MNFEKKFNLLLVNSETFFQTWHEANPTRGHHRPDRVQSRQRDVEQN